MSSDAHPPDVEVVQESGFDIDNETMIGVTAVLAMVIAAAILFVQALVNNLERSDAALKGRSGVELAAYKAEEEKKLTAYAWADKDKDLAKVPLDKAIELTAQKGLSTPPPPAPPSEDTKGAMAVDDDATAGGAEDDDDAEPAPDGAEPSDEGVKEPAEGGAAPPAAEPTNAPAPAGAPTAGNGPNTNAATAPPAATQP